MHADPSSLIDPPMPSLEELSAWAIERARRVLVVDDSLTNRLVIRGLLEKAGFRVSTADGGWSAVHQMAEAEEAPDAVLMDVSMPDIDGLEATARIRALPPPRGTVAIIGLTANNLPEDRQQCLDAGMDAFVIKPAGKRELLAILHWCLESSAG